MEQAVVLGDSAAGERKAAMRLLIAEDDKALGLFLSRGLEADGHRVRVACDGAAAVQAFCREMPDLTILDLNLPIKDGEQVLAEIRAMDAARETQITVSGVQRQVPLFPTVVVSPGAPSGGGEK